MLKIMRLMQTTDDAASEPGVCTGHWHMQAGAICLELCLGVAHPDKADAASEPDVVPASGNDRHERMAARQGSI